MQAHLDASDARALVACERPRPVGGGKVAGVVACAAELDARERAVGVELEHPLEQRACRVRVALREQRVRERARAVGERGGGSREIRVPERRAGAVRLVEVVHSERVALADAGGLEVEPRRDARMQLCLERQRQRRVRRVADQAMPELEVVRCCCRLQQVRCNQLGERLLDVVGELAHLRERERAAEHRAATEQVAFAVGQPLDAAREQ